MELADHQVLSPDEFRAQQKQLQQQRMRQGGRHGQRPMTAAGNTAAAAAYAIGASATADRAAATDADAAAAYAEFCSTCRALSLKANTGLLQHVDTIRHGTVVDLVHNFAGAAGLQAMTPLLARNPHLQTLRLPHNGITNDAVVFFCRALIARPTGALRTLTHLDLSQNAEVSLAGGLGVLSVVQHEASVLTEVVLDGTQVPDALRARLRRALATKASAMAARTISTQTATAAAPAASAPAQAAAAAASTEDESDAAAQARFARLCAAWTAEEPGKLAALRDRLAAEVTREELSPVSAGAVSAVLPVPADAESGWRVVEVPMLAPAGLFESELNALLKDVFPRLNAAMVGRRVALVPLVFDGVNADGESEAFRPASAAAAATAAGAAGSRTRPELRHMHFTTGTDLLTGVARGRLLAIELICDRPGSHLLPPTGVVGPAGEQASPAPPLHPVMYAAHDVAVANARWLLVATRAPTRRLPGLPPTIAALLSSEPVVEHPDNQRALVRRVAVDGRTADTLAAATGSVDGSGGEGGARLPGVPPLATRLALAPQVEAELWGRHEAFRAEVVTTAPARELVVADYPARFDRVADDGTVRLGGLEVFAEAIFARLLTLLTAIFPTPPGVPPTTGAGEGVALAVPPQLLVARAQRDVATRAVLSAMAAATPAKKSLASRLSVYVTAPPSRNSLILHGPERAALTAALAGSAARLLALPSAVYRVAYHDTGSSRLCEEPTDPRAVMVSLLTQLTPNPTVLQYAHEEVDVGRLRRFFTAFLSGVASPSVPAAARPAGGLWTDVPTTTATTLAEAEAEAGAAAGTGSTVLVLVLDGLDAVEAPVQPCAALRREGLTGADEWPTEAGGVVVAGGPRGTSAAAAVGGPEVAAALLPRCLARNVRVMASTLSRQERLLSELRQRGRDSTELFEAGATSAADVEHALGPAALAAVGVTLSDEAFLLARAKAGVRDTEYQHYLVDALRQHAEEPGTVSQAEMIAALPETVTGMAERVLARLERAFGSARTACVLGLLRCSRWGVPALVLRARLRLSPESWERMRRLLRPALEPAPVMAKAKEATVAAVSTANAAAAAAAAGGDAAEDGNALTSRVRLAAPSLLALLERRELAQADSSAAVEDGKVWHRALAHHYLAIVHRALPGRAVPAAAATATTLSTTDAVSCALLRHAVKELTYHAAHAGLWNTMDQVVLSIPFMELVYAHGLGYPFLRDLVVAFNLRHDLLVLGEDIGAVEPPSTTPGSAAPAAAAATGLPRCLARMRAYTLFAREHGRRLMAYPSLVVQVALERGGPCTRCVQADAQAYVLRQQSLCSPARDPAPVYFIVANATRRPATHHGAVTTACATRSRAGRVLFVTAAVDRTLCWLDSTSAGAIACRNRQPTARVAAVATTRTAAYVGALAEDRSVYVYDANTAALVSRGDGAGLVAPVASFLFSAGGRYYFCVTEDGVVRAYDVEKGFQHFALTPAELRLPAERVEAGDGLDAAARALRPTVVRVAPHPTDDERFLTVADGIVRQWTITASASRDTSLTIARGARSEGGVRLTGLPFEPASLLSATWVPLEVGPADEPHAFPHVLLQFRAVERGSGLLLCDLRRLSDAPVQLALPAPIRASHASAVQRWSLFADGAWLAVALTDGRLCVYALRQWAGPQPACVLDGFADTNGTEAAGERAGDGGSDRTVPVSGLALHLEAGGVPSLIALGREREVRYWRLADRLTSGLMSGSDGMFVLDAPATCLACPESAFAEGVDAGDGTAARVAVGDVHGAVVMLRLWEPSVHGVCRSPFGA